MNSCSAHRRHRPPWLQFRLLTLFLVIALVAILVRIFGRAFVEYGFVGGLILFLFFAVFMLPFLWLCWRELTRSVNKSTSSRIEELPDKIDAESIESETASQPPSAPRGKRKITPFPEAPWFQPSGIGPRGYRSQPNRVAFSAAMKRPRHVTKMLRDVWISLTPTPIAQTPKSIKTGAGPIPGLPLDLAVAIPILRSVRCGHTCDIQRISW